MLKLAFLIWLMAMAIIAAVSFAIYWWLPDSTHDIARAIAFPVIIIGTGLCALLARRQRERRDGSFDKEGVERTLAVRAQSGVMVDAIIVALALGCVVLYTSGPAASAPVFAIAVFIVGDFYVRFGVLTHSHRGS